MNSKVKNAIIAGLAIMALLSAAAQGQQPPHPAPSAGRPAPATPPAAAPGNDQQRGNGPQQTTATYGDWVVQCVVNTSPPSEPVCDMAQVTQLQGKNVPFSRIAVAHPEKGQPVKLVVQVPVNASFATQVHIQTNDQDPGIVAPFASCNPNGCFAEFDLKEDVLKKLRDANGVGKLSFADAGGHDVTVPISYNGFAPAFDALGKK